ncbi:serine hydrolase [Brevibacillus sp. SYP-B805]|uniref:serine hydrolase n=1 Tax=Brevibacillus sp. SYP-B805 TaxID=1578199 RepID=UPI0013EBDDD7|nr:serine hydrolase [Brevibacillus sp. SYP-B805]NGQ95757.1 serine hydrolase [Brevibacillus sp. SYP-B805]
MIVFSSNANTEYLMERLGLDNINRNLSELGLSLHEPLYPFVSSLLIPYELMRKYPDMPIKEAAKKAKDELSKMTREEFRQHAFAIHMKLRNDQDGRYKQASNLRAWYDSDFDQMNSNYFIASTTKDYVSILQKMNSRTFFESSVQKHLNVVMEGIMQNPANQSWLEHAGRKGGSTAYVLTEAMYATDKQGNQTELAMFFHRLSPTELTKLSSAINAFELKLLRDSEFRRKIQNELDHTSD